MERPNRRAALAALGAVGLTANLATSAGAAKAHADHRTGGKRLYDVCVVGAGVFGAWTAWHLHRSGKRVLLLDAHGPGHARSSSGGESRMIRSDYGNNALYTQMSLNSLDYWKQLNAGPLPIFHDCGVLFMFDKAVDYARQSIAVHRDLALPLTVLDKAALTQRFPQIDMTGIELGLYEPAFGALMARRAVQTVVADFVERGGQYEQQRAQLGAKPGQIDLSNGDRCEAAQTVFACGPWMKTLFPDLLSERLFVTRQEVAFFATGSAADAGAFLPGTLPGWADWNGGDLYYGFPDLENRGFKIAYDKHGAAYDPDTGDRRLSADGEARLRSYMAKRFPTLADQPLLGARVCQYTNSSNGDFLVDFHPDRSDILLVGAGSGHGFKHGPEVGRLAAAMLVDGAKGEPRFSLASKSKQHNRRVV